MGDATQSQPKCLTRLAGRSLVEWQLAALARARVEPVALVTGYRNDLLAGHASVQFHNPRWSETNMVGSLLCADAWLAEAPAVVSYSDIVYSPDHVRALARASAPIAMTYDTAWRELWELRFADPLSDAESFQVDASGRVVEIGRRIDSLDAAAGQYMGLLCLRPEGWSELTRYVRKLSPSERDGIDMTSLLRGLIRAGVHVQGVPVHGRWCEVDNQGDLEAYEARIAAPTPWSHDWRRASDSGGKTWTQ